MAHLEFLEDMTTDTFINCLCGFIAIRGQIRNIPCDQGSNFVGGRNELRAAFNQLNQSKNKDILLRHSWDFVFNTPASSYMSGV